MNCQLQVHVVVCRTSFFSTTFAFAVEMESLSDEVARQTLYSSPFKDFRRCLQAERGTSWSSPEVGLLELTLKRKLRSFAMIA
jgi:hypothetical protein